MPRRELEPNYDPYGLWDHPYLEVEDVRPVDEQGDAGGVWGIPGALTLYIFQFLTKKNFMLLRRVSKGTKRAVENAKGLLFDAYQERLGEVCQGVATCLFLDENRRNFNYWDGCGGGAVNGHKYKLKNRVSIAYWPNPNSRQLGLRIGYVVKVTKCRVTYVREETMFLTDPIIEYAHNISVAHVRPYIGEVGEQFTPPPARIGEVEAQIEEIQALTSVGNRDNYSSDDNKSLFSRDNYSSDDNTSLCSNSDDDGSTKHVKNVAQDKVPH